jgi:hypothetical protein
VEAVARSVWRLVAALFPSVAVVPRSSAAGRSSFWCSWCFGVLELVKPSPDHSRWWIRLQMLKRKMMVDLATVSTDQGAGSLEPLLVDFPAVEGPLRLSQASTGAVAAARRRLVFVVDLVGIQKDPCVIFVSNLDLLVRTGF